MSNHSTSDTIYAGSPASQPKAIDLSSPASPSPGLTVSLSSADQVRFVYYTCHRVSWEFLEDFHRECAQVDPDEPSTELRRQSLELQRKYPLSLSIINNTRVICEILKLQSAIVSTISGQPSRDIQDRTLYLEATASFIRDAYESSYIGELDSPLSDIYYAGLVFCDITNRRDQMEEILKREKEEEEDARMEATQEKTMQGETTQETTQEETKRKKGKKSKKKKKGKKGKKGKRK